LLKTDEKILLSCQKEVIYEVESDQNSFLNTLLQDASIIKITYDLKALMHHLNSSDVHSAQDVMLMYYAISAGNKQLNIGDMIAKLLPITNNHDEISKAACAYLHQLYLALNQKLAQDKALPLYYEIDLPLCHILYEMERTGMDLDCAAMAKLSKQFSLTASELEEQIFQLAGKNFNLASPKQLGEVLFDHLGLSGGKKLGKSQHYATDIDVLEELKSNGIPIASHIIDWRHLTKLKNTYTDSLPVQISSVTGKLHTRFSQISTTTSRLSSLEPNLQNIPIRSQDGLQIRSCFIAAPGCKMISADYSQVELRILAEIADVKAMKKSFEEGQDIHTKCASEVFGINLNEVTTEQRRKAKAINFGIVYGISAYGLAKNLGISAKQAQSYIEQYFAQYPEIKHYFESTKAFAQKHGFVLNLLGRRCFIGGINDKNYYLKNFAERAAINAPIQGTAAEITKIAMLKVDKILKERQLNAKMILQVHDSIMLISAQEQAMEVAELTKQAMESAHTFSSKLVADVKVVQNWGQA
jgi:DNA polymerase-1